MRATLNKSKKIKGWGGDNPTCSPFLLFSILFCISVVNIKQQSKVYYTIFVEAFDTKTQKVCETVKSKANSRDLKLRYNPAQGPEKDSD